MIVISRTAPLISLIGMQDSLFRWKVTLPVLTFRSYTPVSSESTHFAQSNDTHLNVDLVTAQNDGDVLAHPLQISVPVWDVLVGDSRSNVKHDDTALALDVVSVSETAEFLLAGSVPDVEADRTEVRVESQRVNLDTKGR